MKKNKKTCEHIVAIKTYLCTPGTVSLGVIRGVAALVPVGIAVGDELAILANVVGLDLRGGSGRSSSGLLSLQVTDLKLGSILFQDSFLVEHVELLGSVLSSLTDENLLTTRMDTSKLGNVKHTSIDNDVTLCGHFFGSKRLHG